MNCDHTDDTRSAVIGGVYYDKICPLCIARMSTNGFSSGFQGFDRRRQYEDHAQDVVQPWDANGKPRLEFLRLYPSQAAKMYDKQTLDELRRQL